MAVLNRESYMERLRSRIGDDTSDEAIAFLEDMSETYADLESRAGEDWKAKYEENDRQWREKYTNRFFDGVPRETATASGAMEAQEEDVKKDDDSDKITFAELFEEREG